MKIWKESVLIESQNYTSFIERYHTPVRRALKIIEDDDADFTDKKVLQIGIRSFNNYAGPGGIFPTLLIQGAIIRLGLQQKKPAANMYQRAVAIKKASKEFSMHFARRQVRGAIRMRNVSHTFAV